MATVVNTTFKLKRGTADRWVELNPILAEGEPGFVYDQNRLKIGDGKTAWNDLPYIDGKREIVSYNYRKDFPIIGDETVLYKASKEYELYQFNSKTYEYEKISNSIEIAKDDNILEYDENGLLSTNIALSYDAGSKEIKLIGKNGADLGSVDATSFLKDGMLNDVEYDSKTNTLTFIWNTDSGIKANTIVLSNLFEPYTAGQGLILENNQFLIKIAENSENFLSVSAEGIKVSGIQAAIEAMGVATNNNINALLNSYATKESLNALTNNVNSNTETLALITNSDSGVLAKAKEYTNKKLESIPVASIETLGLVKIDNITIKLNEENQLDAAEVSTDILTQGEKELILNGGNALNN